MKINFIPYVGIAASGDVGFSVKRMKINFIPYVGIAASGDVGFSIIYILCSKGFWVSENRINRIK